MEETFLVLMIKDKKTGFLEKELSSYKIDNSDEYIVNIYAEEKENTYNVHMKVSFEKEVLDWEFNAIYDYYDADVFEGLVNEIIEVSDCFNPTWEIVFDYIEDEREMEEYIKKIISIHEKEVEDTFFKIKDLEDEYLID